MAPIIIYLAGFKQHAGKTIASIGLLSILKDYFNPEELGYIKPVGQELVKLSDGTEIDKDVRIIDKFSCIPNMKMDLISPVRIASGFTKKYLDSDSRDTFTALLKQNIFKTVEALSKKKVIIAEGTGHPGVGSIIGLSNADVCSFINADVIYIAGGGLGNTLDKLDIDLSYFYNKKNRVKGIIFNKLIPEKVSTIKKYITEDFLNNKYKEFGADLKIYGFLPEIKDLFKPSMKVIKDRFKKSYVIGDTNCPLWEKPCENIKVISLITEYLKPEKYINKGDIVIIGSTSQKRKSKILNLKINSSGNGKIGGIILTSGLPGKLDSETENQIIKAGIPAIYVEEDTALAEQIVLKAFENTKLQLFDTNKIKKIKLLFENHFDTEKFLDSFSLRI